MLKLVKIKDPSLKTQFIKAFSPKETRFVVSDIKNKVFLSAELFKQQNFLEGPCVLRADEFYKSLFESLNTRWTIRSNSFIKALLSEFLSCQPSHQVKNMAYSQIFFEFLDLSFPFFLNHSKIFEEWFLHKTQTLFPQYWLDPAQKFCEVLKSKNMAFESVLKALLLDQLLETNALKFNSKKLLVDLSFSLDFCEKEIFKELSKYTELFVLCPELDSEDFFQDQNFSLYKEWEKELHKPQILLFPQDFKGLASTKTRSDFKPSPRLAPQKSTFERKFFQVESESQWMEVKKALTQVHFWLSKGISLQEITLYAPNIEDYWFALKSYLEKESLPFKKNLQTQLLDFPEIQYLVSALRLHLGLLSFEDLESFCFYKASKKNFSYIQWEHSKVLNKTKIQKLLFKEKIKEAQQQVRGSQFIPWVLSFCPADFQAKTLEALLAVLNSLHLEESLSYQSWLKLFEESLLSQKVNEQEEKQGLSCLSFNAFNSDKNPYVFILGLTESAFKKPSLINEATAKSLLNDLGMPMAFQPSQKQEKNLLWFLQSSHLKEVYLSSHLSNFQGEIQNKSLIFMLAPRLYSATNPVIPVRLNYDIQQKSDSFSKRLKGKTKQEILFLQQAFKKNKSRISFSIKHLSPSQIKKYRDCPFKYAADKLLHVPEKNPLERELSALEQGSSVHRLFKEVLTQYPDLQLNSQQKDQLILSVLPPDKHFIHKKQKLLTQQYLKQKLNEFLNFEQEQKQDCPSLKPIALEKELECFWDQKRGELSDAGDYTFKAYVDRIDQDQKTKDYVVRDYKARLTGLTHIKSWLKEGQEDLQLILYAQALQKGLMDTEKPDKLFKNVFALFYSAYNEEFKAKGFVEKEHACSDVIKEGRGYKQEAEILQQAITQTNLSVQKIVGKMEEGDFEPQPQKEQLCPNCNYKKWCRLYV